MLVEGWGLCWVYSVGRRGLKFLIVYSIRGFIGVSVEVFKVR